ncbi:MAG: hypothetical protein ABIK99_06315 [candidate division WOR-3 bacterium]
MALFTFLFLNVSGFWVEKVQIRGNRNLPEVANLQLFSRSKGEISDSLLELDRRHILSFYQENGFWATEVSVKKIERRGKFEIIFEIEEGKRMKYKWSGRPESLPVPIKLVVKKEEEIEGNIHRLLEYYANQGRPFAQISPKNFLQKEDTIFYDLAITEGEEVIINSLSFSGNLTKEAVLKKMLSLPFPFLFSEKKIKSRMRRLTQDRDSPIEFKGMEILTPGYGYTLLVHIQEPIRQELGLFFTYLPKEKEPAGFFSLTLPNLFYTRRKLKLEWEKYPRSLRYHFFYAEPLFLFTRQLKISFTNKTYDTLEVKSSLEAGFNLFTPQDFLTFSFLFGSERVREKKRNDIRFTHLGQELVWETREGILPRSGQYFSFYSYFGERRDSTAKGIKGGLRLKGEMIFDLKRFFPHFSFWAEGIFAETLLEREKTYLGGRERLRGFKEEELPSSLIFLLRQNWKLPLGNSFFYPFFDFGVREKEGGAEWRGSFGFGLELLFRKTYFELIYGVPFRQNLLTGRIHLLMKIGI